MVRIRSTSLYTSPHSCTHIHRQEMGSKTQDSLQLDPDGRPSTGCMELVEPRNHIKIEKKKNLPSIFILFFFLVELGFEVRVSHLQIRSSTS
jgi:hypothetical protein